MNRNLLFLALIIMFSFLSCEKEIRNIAEIEAEVEEVGLDLSGEVNPVNINEIGFDLLESMQGHWIGSNRVITDDWDWFAFDYRAISPSQIHGIFEGGSIGNLFTDFFVTEFKNTRTIMARNGGVLNGIYRTSYFVLDSVNYDSGGDFYRLIDAEGGTNTMWMELRFTGDSLYFNAYTSRLGLNFPPTRHMTFKAKKFHAELAESASDEVNFPQNQIAWDFSNGFNQDYLEAESGAKSATFLALDENFENDVYSLAEISGDPYTISDQPYLSSLHLEITQNPEIVNSQLLLYLSRDPLTDNTGYFLSEEAFETVLLFPSLAPGTEDFLITYLHPGSYYVNITADTDENGFPSAGDFTHTLKQINIDPESHANLLIDNINVLN